MNTEPHRLLRAASWLASLAADRTRFPDRVLADKAIPATFVTLLTIPAEQMTRGEVVSCSGCTPAGWSDRAL